MQRPDLPSFLPDDRRTFTLGQPHSRGLGSLLERACQGLRVRGDQHLAALAGVGDQLGQSGQQIRMQAGLRLIESEERRSSWRQERGD